MKKLIAYLKLFGMFKNINQVYREETGKDRPPYLSRRFIGMVILLAGAVLSLHFGTQIDQNILEQIIDNLDKVISAGMVIYGLVMGIVGILKREKK